MSTFDLNAELDELGEALDLLLGSNRPELVPISEQVRRSIGLRRDDVSWPRSFSPVVSLYPLLQAEPYLGGLGLAARQACLPHLLLLIHSFIEDRHLDGQRPASRAEMVLSKQLFCDAQTILRALADEPWVQSCVDSAVEEYGRGQLFSLAAGVELDRWPEVRRAVAGRAKLAIVTSQFVLRLANVSNVQLAGAHAAFDALVVGMQWEDDLVDWRDDLSTGTDNLLLWRLGCVGAEPRPDAEDIAKTLQTSGVARDAINAARAEWHAAAKIQRELGAHSLAELIEARVAPLESFGVTLGV